MDKSLREQFKSYLKNEIKVNKDQDVKNYLTLTLNHLNLNEKDFERNWTELFEFIQEELKTFNQSINSLDLYASAVHTSHSPGHFSISIDIFIKKEIKKNQYYSYGLFDISNIQNEIMYFSGRVTEAKKTDDFKTIKKIIKKEFKSEETLQSCNSIHQHFIANIDSNE